MMQWLTENEIALYSNSPKYFVEKTPPKLPNASISVESKDGKFFEPFSLYTSVRGGPNFDPVKYVKEVSHVEHMHAD